MAVYNKVMGNRGFNVLKEYEEQYWQTIAKGKEFLPKGVLTDSLTAVQQVVIYACMDGYLILRYGKREGNEFIITRDSSVEWQALLHQQKLYDQYGRESTQRFTLGMNEPAKFEGHSVSISEPVIRRGGLMLRPKYLSATIVVGEPRKDFPNGDETAKKDIQTFVVARNLRVKPVSPGEEPVSPVKVARDRSIEKLESLLTEYKQCLEKAECEEDIQKFLKQNPFILNPWSTTIHPKYRLGSEYVCDFLIEDPTAPDFKHIFVEIEPAATMLFLKSKNRETEFRAKVHQALKQLRDWEIWIRDNISYLKQQDFPEFDQAGFILVVGRSIGLSPAQRRALVAASTEAKNRTVLTYDDLANRLKEFINSLRELTIGT